MKRVKKTLVIKPGGAMRVVNNPGRGRLKDDEVGIPIVVNIPDEWGRIDNTQEITINVPKPPRAEQEKKKR